MMLDTNALSAFIDGDRALEAILIEVRRPAIPVIVLGEFRYGAKLSRFAHRYEEWLASNLRLFDVLHVTAETTPIYASVRVDLKKAGAPIPANDVWIAALSRQHKLPIVSRDGHFDVVPGVRRVSW